MKPGHTYRHDNCLDIDMHVLKVPYHNDRYLKARVVLVNRFNGIVYETLNVCIHRDDLKLWRFVK